VVTKLLGRNVSSEKLTEAESKKILQAIDLPVSPHKYCLNVEEAVTASQNMNFPLVVKMVSKEIVHKSDVGGVVLNINSSEEVRIACHDILGAVDKQYINGFLVEEMAAPGIEFIIGYYQDATFGSVMMFGLGGIFTELLKDFTIRSLPINEHDAKQMVKGLKNDGVLKGFRNMPEVNVEQLQNVLMSLGGPDGLLTTNADSIKEVDINPIIYNGDGVYIVDASIILNEKHADYGDSDMN